VAACLLIAIVVIFVFILPTGRTNTPGGNISDPLPPASLPPNDPSPAPSPPADPSPPIVGSQWHLPNPPALGSPGDWQTWHTPGVDLINDDHMPWTIVAASSGIVFEMDKPEDFGFVVYGEFSAWASDHWGTNYADKWANGNLTIMWKDIGFDQTLVTAHSSQLKMTMGNWDKIPIKNVYLLFDSAKVPAGSQNDNTSVFENDTPSFQDNEIIISLNKLWYENDKLHVVVFVSNGYSDVTLTGISGFSIKISSMPDMTYGIFARTGSMNTANLTVEPKKSATWTFIISGNDLLKTDVDLARTLYYEYSAFDWTYIDN